MGHWQKWFIWRNTLVIVHGNHCPVQLGSNILILFSRIRRHHSIDANKTKSMKHVSVPLFSAAGKADESRKQYELKKPIKHYQLPNVPLYHAAHGQLMHRTIETEVDSIRNRSSIQKRASKGDWLSRNISMVLEQLLMHYENSYLPTHGQGAMPPSRVINRHFNVSFRFRHSDGCQNKYSDSFYGPCFGARYGKFKLFALTVAVTRWRVFSLQDNQDFVFGRLIRIIRWIVIFGNTGGTRGWNSMDRWKASHWASRSRARCNTKFIQKFSNYSIQ